MTHRPVRSLAALLAVLMVLFAFPALPIFAESGSVKNITFKFEGLGGKKVYLFDALIPFEDVMSGDYNEHVLEVKSSASGSLKLGTQTFDVSNDEQGNVKLSLSSGIKKNVKLGVAVEGEVERFDYAVAEAEQLKGSLVAKEADGVYYFDDFSMTFGSIASNYWKQISEESITITFTAPEKTYDISWERNPSFTVYDVQGKSAQSTPIKVLATTASTAGYEFSVSVGTGYSGVPYVTYYEGDDPVAKVAESNGVIDGSNKFYKFKIPSFEDNIELHVAIMAPVAVDVRVVDTLGHSLSNGVTTTAPNSVAYGGTLKFNVTAKAGYSVSSVKVNDVEKASGFAETTKSDIEASNVIAPVKIEIVVDKVRITQSTGGGYRVTLTQGKKSITDWANLTEDLVVEVELLEGYTNAVPTITVNGNRRQSNTHEDSKYTFNLSAPSEPMTITVNGVSKNQYTVTLPDSGAGYSVSSVGTVDVFYGGKITFRVTLEDAYEFTGEKIVNTDLSGKASVKVDTAGNVYTVTVSEIKGNIVLTLDTEHIKTKTFGVSVDGDQKNFKIVEFGQDSFGDVTVDYNEQVSFNVTPNTGYWIESVTYTMGGRTLIPSLTGNTYVINSITSNVEITVVCTAIKVKVTYIYPDLTVFGNKQLTKADEVEEYSLDNNNGSGKLSAEGGFKLTLKTLDDNAKKGVRFEGWTYGGRTIAEGSPLDLSSVTVVNGEINIQVTANWRLIINDSATANAGADASNGAVYVDEKTKPLTQDTDEFYRLSVSGSLQSALQNTLWASFVEDVKILKVGMVYAKDRLTNADLEGYENKLLTMPGSDFLDRDGGSYYAYVHTDLNNFTAKSSYTQKVNFGKEEIGKVTRYASIFFVVEIGGETHVIFGAIQTLSYVADH